MWSPSTCKLTHDWRSNYSGEVYNCINCIDWEDFRDWSICWCNSLTQVFPKANWVVSFAGHDSADLSALRESLTNCIILFSAKFEVIPQLTTRIPLESSCFLLGQVSADPQHTTRIPSPSYLNFSQGGLRTRALPIIIVCQWAHGEMGIAHVPPL